MHLNRVVGLGLSWFLLVGCKSASESAGDGSTGKSGSSAGGRAGQSGGGNAGAHSMSNGGTATAGRNDGGGSGDATGNGGSGDATSSGGQPAVGGSSGAGNGGGATGGTSSGTGGTGSPGGSDGQATGGVSSPGAGGLGGMGGESGEATAGTGESEAGSGASDTGGQGGSAGTGAQNGGGSGLAGGSGLGGQAGAVGQGGECASASDCDAKFGARGCGVWQCSFAGTCDVALRCDDHDLDGFGVGPDCECSGKALDCDDGDPEVDGTASAACCDGGTRACSRGRWGLCSTRGGETCNGADDDCNGAIDDVPEVSCGLGACHVTVPGCSGNKPSTCVPLAPTATVDDCNGIDDDCDGAVDEDCAVCIHVAPDGNDALAAGNDAATPFASVQAALDFADGHREVARRVCVASGSTCGATASFNGPAAADLMLREGIGLLGGYESTTWTRCAGATTQLNPQTGRGVVFPPNIALETVLDGFSIMPFQDDTSTAAVTVDAARGALISNVKVGPVSGIAQVKGQSFGIDVAHGGLATIARSLIATRLSSGEAVGIRSIGAQVLVEDNCSGTLDTTTGRCGGSSGSGNSVQALGDYGGGNAAPRTAILLEDSPGSRVERSTVIANSGTTLTDLYGIHVTGLATDVVIRANTLSGHVGSDAGSFSRASVKLDECGDAAPWLADNDSISFDAGVAAAVISAVGDCHPVIEANAAITMTQNRAALTLGIECRAGSVPSRCTLATNASILGGSVNFTHATLGDHATATGIVCQGQSCQEIRGNGIVGMQDSKTCTTGCYRQGTGVSLDGGKVNVLDNQISSGSSVVDNQSFWGLLGSTAGTLARNTIDGGASTSAPLCEDNTFMPQHASSAIPPTRCSGSAYCPSLVWGSGGVVRNNCIHGQGTSFPAFRDGGPGQAPQTFTNNHLDVSSGASGSVYYLHGSTALTTIDQVNAIADVASSGNDAHCP